GGALVVAVALAAVHAGALGSIWHQAFTFHRTARGYGGGEPNGHAIVHFLEFRTPSAWLIVLGAVGSLVVAPRVCPFWLWAVACDQPIVAFQAGRRLPGELVDTSLVRLQTGSLPPARVLEILRRDRIRAVFVGRSFADEPALLAALRTRYPRRLGHDGVAIYARAGACGRA